MNAHHPLRSVTVRSSSSDALYLWNVALDPAITEDEKSWAISASYVHTVNIFLNGISVSSHSLLTQELSPASFQLRLPDTKNFFLPTGDYSILSEGKAESLRTHLQGLAESGVLEGSVVYLGVTSDPFHPFSPKFELIQQCLRLLRDQNPGLVVLQTRSPAIAAALPELEGLREKLIISMAIETPSESAAARYTPDQPSPKERLKVAHELTKSGFRVNIVSSPVLPYGDFYKNAWDFAEQLVKSCEWVTLGSLYSGRAAEDERLSTLPIVRKLSADKMGRWLRPNAHAFLSYAVNTLDPSKLRQKRTAEKRPNQLPLFAA